MSVRLHRAQPMCTTTHLAVISTAFFGRKAAEACYRRTEARKVFYLAHFLSSFQSVTIRGVSTKLKVNSGRTTPSRHRRQKGIDHLDGFQVSLATTQPLNNAKGVAKSQYSERTNLQIDQDLHPGPRTFAPVVLPALLSTYLPAQARQLNSASNWLLCSSRVLRSINGDQRHWNVLTLHGS